MPPSNAPEDNMDNEVGALNPLDDDAHLPAHFSHLKLYFPQSEDAEGLPYVALDFKKRQPNSRRHRGPEDSVYSGVRLKNVD